MRHFIARLATPRLSLVDYLAIFAVALMAIETAARI